MLEQYKALVASQFEAAFLTLKDCIDQCPEPAWTEPVCNHGFDQSAFHTLFYADVYLGLTPRDIEDQQFHRQHAAVFAGYEQWDDEKPTTRYTREFINLYLQHCRCKTISVLESETEDQLSAASGFDWIKGPRAEVHVYNIRHIQHHAAQLSLRLRLNEQTDIKWQRGVWTGD